jgi:hypothetical protein
MKFLATDGTYSSMVKFLSTCTHPSDSFCRITHHKGMIEYIFRHNSTSTNKGVFPNGMAADDGAVGSQCGTLLDEGGADLVHLGDFCTRVIDVRKDHRRAAEDTIFQCDTLVDGYVVLNFAFVADGYVGADNNILADIAVFTNLGTGKDVGEVPYL